MSQQYTCPHCGHTRSWPIRERARKCRRCRREWTARPAYPVAGFRLTKRDWYQILDTYLRDGVGTALVRECGLEPKRVYRIVRRIQAVMDADVPKTFSGIAEVDVTFVGGAWKNKRIHIRRRGTKRGRGTSKQALFGIAQRTPARVRVFLVTSESQVATQQHITRTVRVGARVHSDECPAYVHLSAQGYTHEFVTHSAGEYVRGDVHTQTLDGFWGRLKNALAARGGIRWRELPRFIAEYVWQYNHRDMSRREQVHRLYRLLKQD